MKRLFLFTLLFFINILNAQEIYFDSISKVKTRTFKYKKIDGKKLKLDFYKPKNIKKDYPLILYVHGGGFSGGRRNENYIKDFANFLTKRGYAVASISYRLTMKLKGFGCNTKAKDKIKAFDTASEDISYALQYILKKKTRFKINPKKIILAGSSAGAEAILHLNYVYKNTILPKNFQFSGIISMAGALISLDNINLKTAIPTQLFHGTFDKLVPFDTAPHHYCTKDNIGYLPLFGSKAIADKLKLLNKSYYLYTIKNGDHSWNSKPMFKCRKAILNFLYFDVLKEQKRQTDITID
ncbi:alpha/beta hydrolase [Polaribacter sp. R77954]|uniref:alpha/beta hydrolase n=1 Tax=Polaribacter sp. R77954 TaxID=3093870 RepID=UPI0037C6B7BA